tara:strand:- start:669 stop:827 length:159 start_codon:yes stop_codon:yes gene_type:complete
MRYKINLVHEDKHLNDVIEADSKQQLIIELLIWIEMTTGYIEAWPECDDLEV